MPFIGTQFSPNMHNKMHLKFLKVVRQHISGALRNVAHEEEEDDDMQ